MAIRIRIVDGQWVALCAVESNPIKGDIYLNDGIHYALACKFARENDLWHDKHNDKISESQIVRNGKDELEKWLEQYE